MRSIVLALLLVSTSALAAKKDPGYAALQGQIAAAPATPHEVAAPETPDPYAWEVGQWTAVRITDSEGTVSWRRTAIVAHDECGWWAELVSLDGTSGKILKVCYAVPAWPRPEAGDEPNVRMIITQDGTKKPAVLDLRTTEGKALVAKWGRLFRNAFQPLSYAEPPETSAITVAGGTFDGCRKALVQAYSLDAQFGGTAWVNSAVPVFGVVKAEDGKTTTELVDFGFTGATTLLPALGGH